LSQIALPAIAHSPSMPVPHSWAKRLAVSAFSRPQSGGKQLEITPAAPRFRQLRRHSGGATRTVIRDCVGLIPWPGPRLTTIAQSPEAAWAPPFSGGGRLSLLDGTFPLDQPIFRPRHHRLSRQPVVWCLTNSTLLAPFFGSLKGCRAPPGDISSIAVIRIVSIVRPFASRSKKLDAGSNACGILAWRTLSQKPAPYSCTPGVPLVTN